MSLDQWRPLLAELCELGDRLCDAIDAADAFAALATMSRMRQIRADLGRVEAERPAHDDPAAMADVAALVCRARVAELVMERWLARPLPGDATLLSTPLGVAAFADAMLPAAWDYTRDVVTLVGIGLEPVAELLADLGQRRIVIVRGGDVPGAISVVTAAETAAAIRSMTPNAPTRVSVRATVDIIREDAEAISQAADTAIADLRVNRNTVHAFSRTWIEQGAANLPAVATWPSIAAIGHRFANLPMVIVAPGPSLANNAHQLASLRGKAVVCAFSHSLKPVLAAGVTPDLIITVDPQDVRYHFAGCDVSRSCLINAATVHPSLFELPARHLSVSTGSAMDDWIFGALGEDAVAIGGGSVATTALTVALIWRCNPIIFVGLDLSFAGGSYYVGTSSDGGARAIVDDRGLMRVEGWSNGFHAMKASGGPAAPSERAVELPGWHGGMVPSSFMFSMFHRWFEHAMTRVHGIRVYNCTEGGARIEGMIHTPLAEVIAELPDGVDAGAILDGVFASVDRRERRGRVIARVAAAARALRRCRRLIGRASLLARRRDPALAGIEAELAEALGAIPFASLLAQREIERALDVAQRPGQDYLAASVRLFETLGRVIDQLEPAFDDALTRLRPRPRERRSHAST